MWTEWCSLSFFTLSNCLYHVKSHAPTVQLWVEVHVSIVFPGCEEFHSWSAAMVDFNSCSVRITFIVVLLLYHFLNPMPLVPTIIPAIDLFASFHRQSIVSGKAVSVCAPSRGFHSVQGVPYLQGAFSLQNYIIFIVPIMTCFLIGLKVIESKAVHGLNTATYLSCSHGSVTAVGVV